MEDLLLQAAQILTPIYAVLPPVAWGIILALLVALLIIIRIQRRRKQAHPLPEVPESALPGAGEGPDTIHEADQEDLTPDAGVPEETPVEIPAEAPKTTSPSLEKSPHPAKEPPPALAPVAEQADQIEEAPSQPMGLFRRLKQGLTKTRRALNTQIDDLFSGRGKLDDELIEELEEMLIAADVGVQTALDIMAKIGRHADGITSPEELKTAMRKELRSLIPAPPPDPSSENAEYGQTPHVIMVVGVNGVGKTTTIGKLAHRHKASGKQVLIAAADTFRAAAVEQLEVWSERAGAELIKHKANSDPAAVAFDGVQAAVARKADLLIIDTAGRLHTKVNLMEELKKIRRAISKNLPTAPHEVLLVLDATTGQNALSQARLFHEAMGVTSIALTKLDGTAKGGIVVGICDTLQLPLQYIGVGEQMDDLQPFDPDAFIDALF